MLLLKILLVLFNFNLYSQMEQNTHYNSIANSLKFHQIDENNILLYGDNGVILRSTDEGDNWLQNFSGTHSNIIKLINVNGFVCGINNNYEFMYSADKGDYWKYIKTNYEFNDLCKIGDDVILSTITNKIYFTDAEGSKFIEKEVPIDSIFYLFSKNENLFIVDRKLNILYSNDFGDNWNEFKINTEISQFLVKKINDNVYLYGLNEIIKINDDLSTSNYVIGLKHRFEFYEFNEGFIILKSSLTTFNLTKYYYNIKDSTLDTLGNKRVLRLTPENHNLIDIIVLDNKLFNSHFVKTILKSEVLSNEYEIVTQMPYTPKFIKFLNDNKIILIDDSKGVQVISSDDGGKFFKKRENYIIDSTSSGKLIEYKINEIYFNTPEKWFMLLTQNSTIEDFSLFYYTKDGGFTFDSIPSLYDSKTRFIDYENDIIYYQSIKDAGPNVNISKLDLNTNEINIINQLDNTSRAFFHKLNENEFLILSTYQNYFEEKNKIRLLKTKDNFKSIELIEEIDIFKDMLGSFYRFNKNLLFFYTFNASNHKSKFFKISGNEHEISEFKDTTLITLTFDNYFDINPYYFENKTLTQTSSTITGNGIDGFSYRIESKYINLNYVESKFEIETLGDATYFCLEYLSEDGSTKYYYSPRHLFIPIEPERLKYYSSVVEKSTPSSIWIYPPYPNPVNDNVSIKFRTWQMNNIQQLKIEIVEISSGKIFHINDYNLTVEDKYTGFVNLDIGHLKTGAFLINFKLGDSNKSEAIIIE